MRYFRQPDQYSCGPTAIANALVWAKVEVKFRPVMPFLQFSCHTRDLEFPNDWDSNGTLNSHFDRTLRYVTKGILDIRRVKNPSVAQMKKHLLLGGAIAFSYHWREKDGQRGDHFVFVPEMKGDDFVVVNDHDLRKGRTSRLRSTKKMREFLKNWGGGDQYATVWLLSRKAAKSE